MAAALAWGVPAHAARKPPPRNPPMVLEDVVPDLPIPPVPPEQPPDDSAAPVPLGDAQQFVSPGYSRNAPGLQPDLFTQKNYGGADGYLAGSGVQGEQNRKVTPPAGFRLNVPIQ